MLITDIGHENIRRPKPHRMFGPIQPIFHFNRTIEYDENLRPIIDVPDIGLVGPMQPHCGAFNFREIARPPGAGGGETAIVRSSSDAGRAADRPLRAVVSRRHAACL